jgi:hypothetical protein
MRGGEGIEDVRVILQHLSGYLFGGVGYAHAGVVCKMCDVYVELRWQENSLF